MALTIDSAEKILAGARAKAREMQVPMSFAVVDAGGYLVALVRMDGAGLLTPSIAQSKAYTAALFRRTSAEMGKLQKPGPSSLPASSILVGPVGCRWWWIANPAEWRGRRCHRVEWWDASAGY